MILAFSLLRSWQPTNLPTSGAWARTVLSSLALLALCMAVHAQDRARASTSRLALVIGNANYKSAPLVNPTNDAEDMASALERLGFTVTVLKNSSLREMKEAVRNFGAELKSTGGTGLFYFAGHGVQSKGRNFLVPSSADITSEADLEFEALDANMVLSHMEEAKNSVNILILDACRDNPFARGWRSASRGLAQMDAPAGTFIAFATAPGQGAADGAGRNGVYTKHLLASLRASGSRLEDVFKRAAAQVSTETSGRQVPWTSSSLTRDFFFRELRRADAISSAELLDMAEAARNAGREAEAKELRARSDKRWIEERFPGAELVMAEQGFKMWLSEQPEKIRWLATSADPDDRLVLLRMFGRDWQAEVERLIEQRHPGWQGLIKSEAFHKWLASQPEDIKKLADSPDPADAIALLDKFKAGTIR